MMPPMWRRHAPISLLLAGLAFIVGVQTASADIPPVCGDGVVAQGETCDDGNQLAGDCCSSSCQIEPACTVCGSSSTCPDAAGCPGCVPAPPCSDSALPSNGWVKTLPSYWVDMALADQDSLFVSGNFAGTIDLGGGAIHQAPQCAGCFSSTDIYLARFDGAGAHVWSTGIAHGGSPAGSAMVPSPDGSLYSWLAEDQPFQLPPVIYFTKYGVDGNPLAAPVYPYDYWLGCLKPFSFDANANVYIGSSCANDNWLAKLGSSSSSWDPDECIDPSCVLSWTIDVGDASDVVIDGPGNVYLVSNGYNQPHSLRKLDTNAVEQWKVVFDQSVSVSRPKVDAAGNLYILRADDNGLDLARLGPNGNTLWSHHLPTGGYHLYSVDIQGSGVLTLFGSIQQTVDWGVGPMTPVTANDVFLIQLDSDGRIVTHQSYAGPLIDNYSASALTSCGGDVFVQARGIADFGAAGTVASTFIAKLPHPLGFAIGSPCSDDDACILGTCAQGVCCNHTCPGPCNTCAAASGAVSDGVCTALSDVVCDDGDACTLQDTCNDGVCLSGEPVVCEGEDMCRTCAPETGGCDLDGPDGTACDDGNACTLPDKCAAGACEPGEPTVCPLADECHETGSCEPASGYCHFLPKPDGTPCPAGKCETGVCQPGPSALPAATASGCSCEVEGRPQSRLPWALLGLVALASEARRRRR